MIVTRLSGMNFDKTRVDSLNDQLTIYVSLTRVPKYHACISHNVILNDIIQIQGKACNELPPQN